VVLAGLPARTPESEAPLLPMWKYLQALRLNTSCKPQALPSLGGAAFVQLWAMRLPEASRSLWAEDAEAVMLEGDALIELAQVAQELSTLPPTGGPCGEATTRINEYIDWQQNWIKAK
jgi:hypothetical protein